MISEEALNKLYDRIIDGGELTTKELNGYGFNSKDLSNLIDEGILERIKRGYYSFLSIDKLLFYGKRLIAEKEYEKAIKCFHKCYELNPNHSGVCFQLFLNAISEKDYKSAFKYFDVFRETKNPYYRADSNFYLYLLSIITTVPSKYIDCAKGLRLEDIRVNFNDKRYLDIPLQNKIRMTVLQRKFPYALKQLKDLISKHRVLTLQDFVTRTLLIQAIEVETNNKNTLLELVKNKSYQETNEFLEDKQRRHNLSLMETYTLKLVNEIIDIQITQKVRKRKIFKTEKLFEAIDGNNYELARALCETFSSQNNIDNSENIIYLLLLDICDLIKRCSLPISKTEEVTKNEVVVDKLEESNEVQMLVLTKLPKSVSFTDIITFLMKFDLENAFRTLKEYMESINKKEYEFLIVDLIKLSIIEKDNAFTKPMIALTYVSRENFVFDISNYIQEFYISLAQNRFDEARIYLDIISKSNKLGQECILTDGLLQVLNNTETIAGYKRNNEKLDSIEKAYNKSQNLNVSVVNKISTPDKVESSISQVELSKTSTLQNDKKNTSSLEIRNSEKEYIEKAYQSLLNGAGMILLKPMNNERIRRTQEMIREHSDVASFIIDEGAEKRIVLRYKAFVDEYVDVKNLLNIGNSEYQKGNYDSCIDCYLKLLQFGEPASFVYAKLGLAYMKKNDKDKAIDYFTVATQLGKHENSELDFTDLIARLKGLIDPEDKKPHFKMKVEEFGNDIQKYYGIDNIDEITLYISESGLDVESACKKLNMTDEQIDIVRLIYARECYSQGDYQKGDQFLNVVEKSKNKSKLISKLLDEIRRNKRFYINRTNANSQKLVLTLQPRKTKNI